jgi:type II secretory pathway component GspD/PulD (secretin)
LTAYENPMPVVRRLTASLLVLFMAATAVAQSAPGSTDLVLHAYTLKHRKASEALPLVSPLLSPRGTVELQPGSNTLVLRDNIETLGRIVRALRTYDHPARPLTLELYIVRASRAAGQEIRSDLPAALTRNLSSLLTYNVYEVRAQALLASLEGQAVTYALSSDYEVSFQVGAVQAPGRVKLSDFRVSRGTRRSGRSGPQPQLLIHTNLSLRLDQSTFLGLARSERSPEALMVVLTLRSGDPAKRPVQRAEQ